MVVKKAYRIQKRANSKEELFNGQMNCNVLYRWEYVDIGRREKAHGKKDFLAIKSK